MLRQLFILVQIKFIFSLPKPTTGFTCFTEILLWSQNFCRICLFTTEQTCLGTNHLWRLCESSMVSLLWVTSPSVFWFWIHYIVHGLTSVVVLGKHRTIYWPWNIAIHVINSTSTATSTRYVSWFISSLRNSGSWSRIFHSTLSSDLIVEIFNFILI